MGGANSYYTTVFRGVIERKKKASPGMEFRWVTFVFLAVFFTKA